MSPVLARVKKEAKLRFPRLYEAVKAQRPATRRQRRHLDGRSAKDIFSEYYTTNAWSSEESVSGAGSTLAATTSLRAALPGLVSDLDIKSLIDAPCGDFHWMREVDLPLNEYIGGDIVEPLIDRLNVEYANDRRRFMVLDLITDPIPSADALFCRDLFLHLSFAQIESIRENFLRSDCQYLIASTYPDIDVHFDIVTGQARPVNMLRAPFNWPEPIRILQDDPYEHMTRQMGVWRRDQL
jgi:hypothetical protein